MKTEVSIAEEIYKRGERLAQQLGLSRSELYTRALADFILKHEQDAITAELDEIYRTLDSSMDPELDRLQMEAMRSLTW